eukprot:snap_masked-scaffold_2-processed-gene-3.16-mRNA-1 protein AED:1.00 eAED:1.00 QI:0/-1/0/0/-1/1/1/0/69
MDIYFDKELVRRVMRRDIDKGKLSEDTIRVDWWDLEQDISVEEGHLKYIFMKKKLGEPTARISKFKEDL